MSTDAFEDFYFEVCTLDYRKLQPGMKALKALMDKAGVRLERFGDSNQRLEEI